jgi:hypothetical protein
MMCRLIKFKNNGISTFLRGLENGKTLITLTYHSVTSTMQMYLRLKFKFEYAKFKNQYFCPLLAYYPLKDGAQTASFKGPVRTAL